MLKHHPMTIEDIKRIISDDETKHLELKKTTGELKDGMHSACAFLNTEGGWLIFGIAPTSLKIVGQDVTESTRRELAQALVGLEPAVDVSVEYIDVPDGKDQQLIVMHFDGWVRGMVPYTYHGRPYIRVESTTKIMPREMFEERLRESKPGKFAWDAQIAEGVAIDDLDEERIRNAVRLGIAGGRINASAEGETVESLLRKFNLLKDGCPTNAAVMLFAKNTDDFPQMLLRMACFDGTDKNVFIDNKQQTGNFFDLLDAGMAFCFRHLNLSGKIVGLRREEHLEIPAEALREALINALCHRQYDDPRTSVSLAIYDDRIEIMNPGRFPMGLTEESIMEPHDSFPTNLKIAQVLYQTTYSEKWGSGVRRMTDLCREQHLPDPRFHLGQGTVCLTFKKAQKDTDGQKEDIKGQKEGRNGQKELTERQMLICALIKANDQITIPEMAVKTSSSVKSVRRDLEILRQKGLLKREGGRKQGHWVTPSE